MERGNTQLMVVSLIIFGLILGTTQISTYKEKDMILHLNDQSDPVVSQTIPELTQIWNFSHLCSLLYTAPAIVDLNGDGRLEAVINTGPDIDKLYVLDALNGSKLWEAVAQDGWSAVAIGDFNGDTLPDVVCPDSNIIKAFCGLNGSIIWSYAVEEVSYRATSSASLADVNNDEKLDVIVGGEDGCLYVIDNSGSQLWNFSRQYSEAWTRACAVGDVDNDNILEIAHIQHWNNYVKLYVLNAEDGSILWETDVIDRYIYDAPVIGDVNGDSIPEVIVSSGDMTDSGQVIAFSGINGEEVWRYSQYPGPKSCPALGDINNDGIIDVVVGWDYAMIALNGSDGSKLWEAPIETIVYSSPALADINGDGGLDVIFGGGYQSRNLYILDGQSGQEIWVHTTPSIGPSIYNNTSASATLYDIDGDNDIEMIVQANGYTYMFDIEGAGERAFWQGYGGTSEFTGTRCLDDVDPDGDFVSTYTENVIGTDNTNPDSDSDTLLDNELYIYGTNPNSEDSEQDGMPDNWEIIHELNPLLNDANEDNDLDGYSNLVEYLNGTDPNVWNLPIELLIVGIASVCFIGVAIIIIRKRK